MSVYALYANGKESWKMTQDPLKNPEDPLQKLINLFLSHRRSSLKMSKSVQNHFRYFADTQIATKTQCPWRVIKAKVKVKI